VGRVKIYDKTPRYFQARAIACCKEILHPDYQDCSLNASLASYSEMVDILSSLDIVHPGRVSTPEEKAQLKYILEIPYHLTHEYSLEQAMCFTKGQNVSSCCVDSGVPE